MRYANASASAIAFVSHGELWTVARAGGPAHRLTNDPGSVAVPRFSPDGRWIAFSWRRAGGYDVYVLPAAGGSPRRLTFQASPVLDDALVTAWTPDARSVVFLSRLGSPMFKQVRAFAVPVGGGLAEPLPLDHAGLLSFAPGGRQIAFNRIFRNQELRKRYVGGQAQDLYTYDFDRRELTRITDWKGTDSFPMWSGRRIYFVSDRGAGFRANIWSYDLDSHAYRQLTDFANYDVDWPSLGGDMITFQQGGRLWAIDLPSERLREVPVDVADDGARTAPRLTPAAASVRATDAMGGVDFALSPRGDSLLVSARGDLFSVSPAGGAAHDLTGTPGADEDHPAWSLDGGSIAYETDASGEQQVVVRPADGGVARALTPSTHGYFYAPVWSPNGEVLAVADASHALWLLSLSGGAPALVARDPYAEIRDAAFSPDGRWLAYSTVRASRERAIHLRELASGRDTVVSSPMESDRSPVFTSDGRLLVFVSQRNEQPFVSDRDDESLVSTLNSDGLYAATLDRTAASPLTAPSAAGPRGPARVDLDGLMSRAVALPVTPTVIGSLQVRGATLFYASLPPQLIDGDLAGGTGALHALDLSTLRDRVVTRGLGAYSLSADGTALAFRRGKSWRLASTSPGGADAAIELSGLQAPADPHQAWTEMFENAWRLDRDVFFSAAMNGDDWRAVHDAYAKLLPRIGSQDDFVYLLGQMQGELASSHTFLEPGPDADDRPHRATAQLGADYALDAASGRYRFAHVYRGDNSRPDMRGPLSAPGLGVQDGDYLLAIGGRALSAPADPASLLAGAKGAVTLSVSSTPSGPGREVQVQPIDDETELRRHDWIEANRERVERLSGGRLGYVFVTDFDADGSRDFVRQFYPQRAKAGLVFDVRWNKGGFTSQAVLDVLRRALAGVFVNREGAVSPLPGATAPKVMVTVINYGSASDGDQFPYFFRRFGLGKLVGERTWGGVQGINGPWRLMDGTSISIPKDALAGLDRNWVIENEGVVPDVAVASRPDEALSGRDAQLEAAVRTALDQLAGHPPAPLLPPAPLPAYPAGGNVPPATFGAAAR